VIVMSTQGTSHGCSIRPAITTRQHPVRVNGVVISRAEIARETQNHPASKPIEAWLAAARALVVRELLLQEARRLCIAPSPIADSEGRRETDDEAMVRLVIEQEVKIPTADESACRRFYDANRKRLRTPDLYEVRHILLPAPPGENDDRRAARERADVIIAALSTTPSAFDDLARHHSACPSAQSGGNLGQISPGQTVPEFERALASLPVGDVAPVPVETRYGVHVVRVERRIEGRDLPFDMVQSRIAHWLDEKVRRVAIRQYIEILAGRAEISGIAFDASPSPLVQ
jgi:peptidyl-prolyl cis-trans isomerase C